ncbi:MAG: carbohydrate ABC transporter permease [Clostridiales bacterium]|jgi:multiple sugar transport system permease protein/putative aldouronate transport system permease protein|nr:carbohydrate ABC transporter permease [Clostridiales bacterium]
MKALDEGKDLRKSKKAEEKAAAKRQSQLMSRGDAVFYIVNDLLLLIFLLLVAYPIIYVFSASFSSPRAVMASKVILWPVEPSIEGYVAAFKESRIWTGYGNTIIYTVCGTCINLIMTILCAYPLSRRDFAGRNAFMFIVAFTMIFSGGMLPTYIVIKELGLIDTRWAMLLPSAIGVYNVIVMRTYYQTNISDELLDAAFLDGCDNFRFLWQIVIPLSKPITAVMILFYGVGHWNAFFNAFIYLSSRKLLPLQIFLREILVLNQMTSDLTFDPKLAAAKQGLADLLKYSLIIVSSLPIWCAYPFVQKYFVKGIMIGSIKG